MTRLLLVRHGISQFNVTRQFAGSSDVELNDEGYKQVESLRDRLADDHIDAVYSSDLQRAQVTADIISSRHEVDIITCPELREVSYGDAEGLTFDEISHRYPEVAALITNFSLKLKFPRGESFEDFIKRVCTFLGRLDDHSPEQTVLVVSHRGPLTVLICHLLSISQTCWWQLRCDNASLSIVGTYPRGAILNLLNDTSHLRLNG